MAGELRVRRSGPEVRDLLCRAACDLFARKGYGRTSTREIAAVAGVSEPLLYKHFGSKAQLFERAVIEPFRDFVAGFAASWEVASPEDADVESLSRAFVAGLYGLLRRNREVVMALLAAHAYEFDVGRTNGSRPTAAFGEALDSLQRLAEMEADRRPLTGLDPPLTIRVTVGMVMAMAVLEDWFFSTGAKPSERRIREEMTQFMAYGLAGRSRG